MLHTEIPHTHDSQTDTIEAESLEQLCELLPEDYTGPALRVTDDAGFVRGWLRGRGDWLTS
jgi:diadenosine tetraphosphatase ApaH/serine/threonine PP2A family protein phosphatase